jgi:hypothetical protein
MSMPFIVDEDIWKLPKKKPGPVKGAKAKLEAKKKDQVYQSEAALSTAIIERYNRLRHIKCQKIKGTAYGKPTLDILGSKHGRLFWLEVKQPGKKPTKRQFNTMQEWIDEGAIATWTTSIEGAMRFLMTDWTSLTVGKMLEGFHGE